MAYLNKKDSYPDHSTTSRSPGLTPNLYRRLIDYASRVSLNGYLPIETLAAENSLKSGFCVVQTERRYHLDIFRPHNHMTLRLARRS